MTNQISTRVSQYIFFPFNVITAVVRLTENDHGTLFEVLVLEGGDFAFVRSRELRLEVDQPKGSVGLELVLIDLEVQVDVVRELVANDLGATPGEPLEEGLVLT